MKLVNEVWKDIKGFEGMYQVSNWGRVRSAERVVVTLKGITRLMKSKMLIPINNGKSGEENYVFIRLRKDGKDHKRYIHRLVAEAFLPNPFNYPQVNHKDGNKRNNEVDNLEFSTASLNIQHAYDNGLIECKISDEDARFICRVYKPRDSVYGQRPLAARFGVSHAAIYSIVHGKNKAKATESVRNANKSDIA